MCHAYAVEKNHPQVVVLFPRPHSNCSRINDFFSDFGWLSIQNKKTIVKRVYYGIDFVKGVISSIAELFGENVHDLKS